MKLSFTTLGCPEWPLDKIVERSVEYGFDAIDFRGLTGEMNIWKLPEFSSSIAETRSKIAAAGLKVSCFSSSVHVFSTEKFEENMNEVKEYAKLCEYFGTRYIRVFGGKIGDTDREQAIKTVVAHLKEMAAVAKSHGVKILIETHDDWISCDNVRKVMEQVDSEAVGVLWDVHHPYRVTGEQPEATLKALAPWIEYTHVKDSRVTGSNPHSDFTYCLVGEGDIPIKHVCELLKSNGYEGYYTLEWEKKWHPEIEAADIAFPHYVQSMKKIASEVQI